MMRSLWTAATGMTAQQLNIDVISNNLANVNTASFKKSRAEFEDLMYKSMRVAGSAAEGDNQIPVGLQVGMGVRPVAVHKFFEQGDFQNTGNALDVALHFREGDIVYGLSSPREKLVNSIKLVNDFSKKCFF